MRSYLSLIPISAKKHRRQNRMTRMCIVFSVFMVTAVFSMAEMGARMEMARLSAKHGGFSFEDMFSTSIGQSLFLAAGVLFFLILAAGILMISSSINSSVAQRTKFFGMMRCLGMSRGQTIKLVRLEALNWCKTAIPMGVVLGIVVTWMLCVALKFLVGEEFTNIPMFGISLVGIISGVIMGIVTVLIAADQPARRASKVSPAAAVSGNAEYERECHAARLRFMKIETALGIRHAVASGKNLVLMTCSFALSIILFLNFSVLIDFADHLMPQSASAADISISDLDGSNAINTIDRMFTDKLSGMEGVKRVYGRSSCFEIPAEMLNDTGIEEVDMISFSDFDLKCLVKDDMLKKGSDISKVYGESGYVLAVWDPECNWETGDRITVGNEELEIAGLLKYDPFSDDGMTGGKLTLISSEETFIRVTGITGFSLVMIQTTNTVTDENVKDIRMAVGDMYKFTDNRGKSTSGTYIAFAACVYVFLAMITIVAVLNIINSISMSATARTRQYGFMRAVGMDGVQLAKMIAAEAFTYAALGCITGCAIGLPLSRMLYNVLISDHFAFAIWEFPTENILVIVIVVILSAAAAVYGPAKRMCSLSVTETINET